MGGFWWAPMSRNGLKYLAKSQRYFSLKMAINFSMGFCKKMVTWESSCLEAGQLLNEKSSS